MNREPQDAILISADPNIVRVDDAIKHLATHEKLYWEVGFRINRDRFTFPLYGFIHVKGEQVKYRATIVDIVPFERKHYEGPLAEQIKPAPWRKEWKENVDGIRDYHWKNALVMTHIAEFSYETRLLVKTDGAPVKQPTQSYARVRPPSAYGEFKPLEVPTKQGGTIILEKNLQDYVRDHPEILETGLTFEKEEVVTKAGRIDLLFTDADGNRVVVELKRSLGTDQVVGQILRYMGCLMDEYGKDKVRGIVIVAGKDNALSYAAKAVPNLQVKEYSFQIK